MSRPKILVLDDQGQYLRSLDRALKDDADLVLTESLAAAEAAFDAEFSLVLTDIRLDENREDDRQGIEFIRFVRTKDADLPIVAMSALEAPDVEAEVMAAGATRFLHKPIVLSQLRELLAELTERSGDG